jgi:1-phosphatidylinositol-4-phosphate 5-kinase
MIKTVKKEEFKKLKSILKSYFNHIKNNPKSLITRFFGLHKVTWRSNSKEEKKYLVVMNNVFAGVEVGLKYDLKGST